MGRRKKRPICYGPVRNVLRCFSLNSRYAYQKLQNGTKRMFFYERKKNFGSKGKNFDFSRSITFCPNLFSIFSKKLFKVEFLKRLVESGGEKIKIESSPHYIIFFSFFINILLDERFYFS